MTLRVLGGELRGRPLHTPRGSRTRPTTSMLRKAVFDILQADIQGTHFLDLFAGSGAMGIEALSRGASHASFVETDRQALRAIHQNLSSLQLVDKASVYSTPVLDILHKFTKEEKNFDLIYADPPYHLATVYTDLLTLIESSTLLLPGGTLFLESLSNLKIIPPPLHHLTPIDQRRFGTSLLHQYRRK